MAAGFSEATVDRDLGLLFRLHARFMDVAHEIQRLLRSRRIGMIGRVPLEPTEHALPRPVERIRETGLARGRFVHGAEDQDMSAIARRDGADRIEQRAELARRLRTVGIPAELEPQRILKRRYPDIGKARSVRAVAGPGRHAVNILAPEPGVRDRLHRGVDGKRERRLVGPARQFRLADPGDRGLLLGISGHARVSTGAKSGTQMSAFCSKRTLTGMPMWTASTGQSTMLVASMTSSCSSIVTSARM